MPMPSKAAGFLGSRPRTASYSVVAPAKSEVRMRARPSKVWASVKSGWTSMILASSVTAGWGSWAPTKA